MAQFAKPINISVDSIRSGFQLNLSDNSFEIIGFRAYYETDDSDIYYKDIFGNSANQTNFHILKNAKKGALVTIECINLKKEKARYTSKPIVIFLVQ